MMRNRFIRFLACACLLMLLGACGSPTSAHSDDTCFNAMNLPFDAVTVDFTAHSENVYAICDYSTFYRMKICNVKTGEITSTSVKFDDHSRLIGADDKGVGLLYGDGTFTKYDPAGNVLAQFSTTTNVVDAKMDINGVVYVLHRDGLNIYMQDGSLRSTLASPDQAALFDCDDGVLLFDQNKRTISLISSGGSSETIAELAEHETPIFYSADAGLYVYDETTIQHLTNNGRQVLERIDITSFHPDTTTQIEYFEHGFLLFANAHVCYLTLEEVPTWGTDTGDRAQITLAAYNPNRALLSEVAAYNECSADYYIEVIDYMEYDNDSPGSGLDQLYLDVATGKSPDIFCFGKSTTYGYEISSKKLNAVGALDDLIAYLKRDPEISEDTILPNLYGALKSDNALYEVPVSYYLSFVVGATSTLNGLTNMCSSEFLNLVKSMGKSPFGNIPREALLQLLFAYDMDTYVNYENGTCSFDTTDFIDLLTAVKICEEEKDTTLNTEEMIRQGKTVMLFGDIGTIQTMQYYRTVFQTDDLTFIGAPSNSGKGNAFKISMSFGISSNSKHTEEAWNFIRRFLLDSYQDSQATLPVTVHSLNKRLRNPEKYEAETYELGEDEYYVSINKPTEVDSNLVRNLLESTNAIFFLDLSLWEIIYEEVDGYLDGTYTAEETANLIQSRVSIYMSEQYQ